MCSTGRRLSVMAGLVAALGVLAVAARASAAAAAPEADANGERPAPAAERTTFAPSALSQPRGTLSLKVNGIMPGLAFAPLDALELEGTGIWLPTHFHLAAGIVKLHLLRSTHLHG